MSLQFKINQVIYIDLKWKSYSSIKFIKNFSEKPTFEITHVKDIVVKSGQNYEIHIPFKAHPFPNTEWTIDDNEIKPDPDRIQIQVEILISWVV